VEPYLENAHHKNKLVVLSSSPNTKKKKKKSTQRVLECGSSNREPALQAQSPEFKPQYGPKE
jgi:hypothetical protein